MRLSFAILVILLSVLFGCGPSPTVCPTPPVVTVVVPVPQTVVVVQQVTVVAVATPTSSSEPSRTLAVSPTPTPHANAAANLRAGPGTDYPIIGAVPPGEALSIVGRNQAGTWFKLQSGAWIWAELVDNPPDVPTIPDPTSTPSRRTVPPPTWTSPPPTAAPTPPPCLIKGNVSYTTGERIYHLPNCPDYDKTLIDARYGERMFCTEAEAQAAGWRKARNCP